MPCRVASYKNLTTHVLNPCRVTHVLNQTCEFNRTAWFKFDTHKSQAMPEAKWMFFHSNNSDRASKRQKHGEHLNPFRQSKVIHDRLQPKDHAMNQALIHHHRVCRPTSHLTERFQQFFWGCWRVRVVRNTCSQSGSWPWRRSGSWASRRTTSP